MQEREDWEEVQVAGIVSGVQGVAAQARRRAHGDLLARGHLRHGAGGLLRQGVRRSSSRCSRADEPLLVTGKVKPGRIDDSDENAAKAAKELNLAEAVPLFKLRAEKTTQMTVELPADALTDERIDALKAALEKYPGPVTTVLRLKVPMRSFTDCVLPSRFNVTPSDELLVRIEKLFGADAARLR